MHINLIVTRRRHPGRPTRKESKRLFILALEFLSSVVVSNPYPTAAVGGKVQFKLSVFPVPLDLDAPVSTGDQIRTHRAQTTLK